MKSGFYFITIATAAANHNYYLPASSLPYLPTST